MHRLSVNQLVLFGTDVALTLLQGSTHFLADDCAKLALVN